ncbi:MAG: hypothetical protein ACI4EI_03115 [Muricoprocola sp.]
MGQIISALGLSFFFIYLLLFPADSLASAQYGLVLWANHVIPVLFPMMLISGLITESNLAWYLVRPFKKLLGFFIPVNDYGIYAMVVGFLCGYPMGCKTLRDLYSQGKISQRECHYLAGFCNNVSPSFVISYVLLQHFPEKKWMFPTLIITYGSPILYGILSGRGQKTVKTEKSVPPTIKFTFSQLDHCISASITAILKLGGYLVPFTILCTIIRKMPGYPFQKYLLCGFLEITNGISFLSACADAFPVFTFLSMICILSFGGLCSAFQSKELLQSFQMSLPKYLLSKLKITLIAFILAGIYLFFGRL